MLTTNAINHKLYTNKNNNNNCVIHCQSPPLPCPATNKMKETDFDSATASLMQEMNLARRACWCDTRIQSHSHSRKFRHLLVGLVKNYKNGAFENFCKRNNILEESQMDLLDLPTQITTTTTLSTTTTVLNDGAIKPKIDDSNHSEASSPNLIIIPSNCKSQSLSLNMSKCATRKDLDDQTRSSPRKSFETSQFADSVSAKWWSLTVFLVSIMVKLQMVLLNSFKSELSEKKNAKNAKVMLDYQNENLKQRRSKENMGLRTLNRGFVLILLSYIWICCCVSSIEARPNLSNALDSGGSATTVTVTESASSTSPFATPTTSLDHGDHGKTYPLAGHGDHPPQRYPVSQVDFDRVKTPFIIGIWILSASIAKIGFHMTPKLNKIFPESCLLIVVGVVIGVVLYFVTSVNVSPLTPNTFFFYMLPPIILDAGYFMPNRLFFDNLGTILLMAVVGTIFNVATIGSSLWACGLTGIYGDESQTPKLLDTFIFASLISAVDPVAVLAVFEEIHVNEILYIVVFGESLLNDAVTVVMYHMMEVYNEIGIKNIIVSDILGGVASFFIVALGGTFIGVIWGVLTGLVTRFTDHVRVIEPIFIFVMAYLAYLNAEIFHMSGIMSITFCGITMKNYVESNISQKSHTTVKYALKMLSSSSETIIFMFLGVATVNNDHVWNTVFVLLTILFCSFFRVIGVVILTAMANKFRLHKLSNVDQFVMSYGGLRGAVAFALVLLIDEAHVKQKAMFVTTTIAVIYFTVFLQGITIKPLVKFLNVKRANKKKPTMNERIHERFMDHLMAGIEDIVGKTGNYNVRDKFKRFDNRFIRPLLIRDLKGAEPKIIETYSKLTMRDAMEVMRRNPSTIGQISGTESMSALFRNYTSNCIGGRWAPPTLFPTCPSLTNLENTCSRNLDMHELDYNPSKKDLTDARIHHLLAEELKPYRRHRRLSYSRHAVDDRDLSTQVNYKLQMNFRRMFKDRQHHKRSKREKKQQQDGVKQNHVSFTDFQQNGTTKQLSHDYINEVLNESAEEYPPKQTEVTINEAGDDWEEGLTFTAKSSLAENVIVEEERNASRDSDCERRVATPTATESQLPWKREEDEISDAIQQNEFPAWASNKEYLAYNSPSATFLGGLSKPKQAKSVIGFFRRESSGSGSGGGAPKSVPLVVDLSEIPIGSDPSLAAALTSGLVPFNLPQQQQQNIAVIGGQRSDKRSASISGASIANVADGGHSGPFPVTASHRRNIRRGSMLELSGLVLAGRRASKILPPNPRDTIPEETHYHSKSLCEPAGDEWTSTLAGAAKHLTGSGNSDKLLTSPTTTSSGREPLLPKLTPRAQIRRMGSRNQVTTALLSTSTSDFDDDDDDDDDDEEEDFDLYDDDNIVVTTYTPAGSSTNKRNNSGSDGASTSGAPRNNDESII
ncbi:sodium/hydrogen exchanger 5 isoform X18 [Episyrphus balteatus]|uniref:sodium/hydrogen exchanger 5 isoform X18 n=1 Tax=Episyrphus balteatus TaxID=286459 RepID=UPI00248527BA|nr:sodium/hydrogen exchanger 5 isoform X18 [Episyrphus balteatus]